MLRDLARIISARRTFFLPYITFVFLSLTALLLLEKDALQIAINKENNAVADVFFKYITFLGDGRMIALYAFILLFIKYRYVLVLLVSNLFAGVVTFILKVHVFNEALRPRKYFENIYELRLVPGVEVYLHNSMPSGHTVTVFCVFTFFALISERKLNGFLFFMIAVITGFSRIYLSQHFLSDVLTGSLIGVSFALIFYYIFEVKLSRPIMDGDLFKKLNR